MAPPSWCAVDWFVRANSAAVMTAGIIATTVARGPYIAASGTMTSDMIAVPVDPPVKKTAIPHAVRPPLARAAWATAWG